MRITQKLILTFLLFFVNVVATFAGCYDETIKAGKAAFNSGKYSFARQCFMSAKQCPDAPANANSICNEWIRKIESKLTSSSPSQADNTENQYKRDLKEGEQLFDDEQYAEAKKHFAKMLAKYPKHKDDINRWIDVCDMMLSDQDSTASQPAVQPQPTPPPAKPTSGYINGHEWIDLGLPSGLKWATCNVGASSPSEYGNYYAWGETTTKSEYTKSNCKTWNKSIGDISGNSNYDAARANWGSSWRMPTQTEFEELLNNCEWTWTTQGGRNGYRVTSKKNGNSIFLPAAGYRSGSSLYDAGVYGLYWSSTPDWSDTQYAYYRYVGSGNYYTYWIGRGRGQSVRAVSE